jgi:hypothetical protein
MIGQNTASILRRCKGVGGNLFSVSSSSSSILMLTRVACPTDVIAVTSKGRRNCYPSLRAIALESEQPHVRPKQ